MKSHPVLFILMLYLMVACGRSHPQVETLLQQAENIITKHPDSAFVLLNHLHQHQPMTQEEIARYAILLTRAANKTYQSLAEPPYDSLMQEALRHYNRNSVNRAVALLYKGRVEMEQQRWVAAMDHLQEADRLIQRANDITEYHRHILSSLSGVYQVLGYEDEAMQTSERLAKLCTTDADRSVVLSQMGDYYNNKEMLDYALHYQHEALRLARQAGDAQLSSMYSHRIGYIFLSMEQYDSALVYLNTPLHPVYIEGRIGEAFYYTGQQDSAFQMLSRYVQSDEQPKDIEAYRLLYEIEKERGHLPQAYQMLETALVLADSIAETLDRNAEMDSLIVAHQKEMVAQQQKTKAREERNWLIMAFVVVVLLAVVFYQQRLRKKERKVEELMGHLLEKDRLIVDSQQQIAQYSQSIDDMHEHQQLLQSWLFTQTPIYHKIVELSQQDFSDPKLCKVLSYKERNDLITTLFSLCANYVEEMKTTYPRLEDDDILLLCLEKYADFDANTIPLCFGTTSRHTISQRRYRMKERLTN
ncbi:MAG: hypothetical protein K5856_02905 [Bacteroidaceae bacterium]|nr:hypothetical protein [Bacteroidaceae bacterium]